MAGPALDLGKFLGDLFQLLVGVLELGFLLGQGGGELGDHFFFLDGFPEGVLEAGPRGGQLALQLLCAPALLAQLLLDQVHLEQVALFGAGIFLGGQFQLLLQGFADLGRLLQLQLAVLDVGALYGEVGLQLLHPAQDLVYLFVFSLQVGAGPVDELLFFGRAGLFSVEQARFRLQLPQQAVPLGGERRGFGLAVGY